MPEVKIYHQFFGVNFIKDKITVPDTSYSDTIEDFKIKLANYLIVPDEIEGLYDSTDDIHAINDKYNKKEAELSGIKDKEGWETWRLQLTQLRKRQLAMEVNPRNLNVEDFAKASWFLWRFIPGGIYKFEDESRTLADHGLPGESEIAQYDLRVNFDETKDIESEETEAAPEPQPEAAVTHTPPAKKGGGVKSSQKIKLLKNRKSLKKKKSSKRRRRKRKSKTKRRRRY